MSHNESIFALRNKCWCSRSKESDVWKRKNTRNAWWSVKSRTKWGCFCMSPDNIHCSPIERSVLYKFCIRHIGFVDSYTFHPGRRSSSADCTGLDFSFIRSLRREKREISPIERREKFHPYDPPFCPSTFLWVVKSEILYLAAFRSILSSSIFTLAPIVGGLDDRHRLLSRLPIYIKYLFL